MASISKTGRFRRTISLTQMYFEGKGVTKDLKEAAKWYQLSAEEGDAHAQPNLAMIHNDGLDSLN